MRTSRITAASLSLALSLVGVSAFAQGNNGNDSTQARPGNSGQQSASGKLSPADEAFLRNEARTANAELQYGRLAQQNGSIPQVKQLGQTMVTNAQTDLAHVQMVAKSAGITLSSEINPTDQHALDELKDMQGEAFDTHFAERVQKSETIELGQLQQESSAGSNPDLQSYANQQMGTVQSILDQSKNVGVTEKQPNDQQPPNGNQNNH
jgi:predicted outer membrane protein